MGVPAVGQVVLVPFPFSDLSSTKVRPAVTLADVGRGDWVLCQILTEIRMLFHWMPAVSRPVGCWQPASHVRANCSPRTVHSSFVLSAT